MSKQSIKLTDLVTPLTIAVLAVFASNAFYNSQKTVADESGIQAFSELYYCSAPSANESCQDGVAKLDLFIESRSAAAVELYGYDSSYSVEPKLSSIEIKFNTKAKDYIVGEYDLYADANDNSLFDSEDELLVTGFPKKKRLVFEGINHVIEAVTDETISLKHSFFVVSKDGQILEDIAMTDELDEPITLKAIDKVTVNMINLADDNRKISNRSSFADRSVFGYVVQRELDKEGFLAANRQFSSGAGEEVVLAGEQTIIDNIIIPPDLVWITKPGANIKLDPGVSIVSYSPANFNGTASEPIMFENSQDEPFGVVSVLGQTGGFPAVNVQYVTVRGGSEAEINGAYMSGMFNVYRSEFVTVENSSFYDAQADDGLNIKNSGILVRNNYFEGNSADAFDGDYIVGEISENLFEDNGNDSLDFSGSDLDIQYNNIINSGDKCISVGEGTIARISFNILDSCQIAVQVKDSSGATIVNNVITGSSQSAINAYIKKSFFGPPTLSYKDNAILGNQAVATGLAAEAGNSGNITSGTIDNLREDTPWVQQIYQRTPQL